MSLKDYFLKNTTIINQASSADIEQEVDSKGYLEEFKNSDIIMKNGFLLGAHHGMTIDDVDYVCDKIKDFFK